MDEHMINEGVEYTSNGVGKPSFMNESERRQNLYIMHLKQDSNSHRQMHRQKKSLISEKNSIMSSLETLKHAREEYSNTRSSQHL